MEVAVSCEMSEMRAVDLPVSPYSLPHTHTHTHTQECVKSSILPSFSSQILVLMQYEFILRNLKD